MQIAVKWNKVIPKISAQYVKEYKLKVRKTVYFKYNKLKNGHNTYKHWGNLTTLQVDL